MKFHYYLLVFEVGIEKVNEPHIQTLESLLIINARYSFQGVIKFLSKQLRNIKAFHKVDTMS